MSGLDNYTTHISHFKKLIVKDLRMYLNASKLAIFGNHPPIFSSNARSSMRTSVI